MAVPLPPAGQDDFVEEVIAKDGEDEPNFKEVIDVVRRMRNKPPGSDPNYCYAAGREYSAGRGAGAHLAPLPELRDVAGVAFKGFLNYDIPLIASGVRH